jgi:CheY-like chemotaxis protein
MKILIAEDNRKLQLFMAMLMNAWGYDFDLASNGQQAVALATAGGRQLHFPVDDNYIAGSAKIIVMNLTAMTTYDEAIAMYVVHAPYTWQQVIADLPQNYTQVRVGPSGRYLYYLADFTDEISRPPYPSHTIFGELGAYEIKEPGKIEWV